MKGRLISLARAINIGCNTAGVGVEKVVNEVIEVYEGVGYPLPTAVVIGKF